MSFDPLSIKNFDGKFSIPCGEESLLFDCERGSGATPNNSNIRYLGFGAIMRPSQFLKLVLPLDNPSERSASHFANPKTVMAPPMLYVKLDGKKPVVTGHEGRHRVTAILRRCGDRRILVHVVPYNLRAHDMDYGRLAEMRQHMLKERSQGQFGADNFNAALVEDRVVDMLHPNAIDVLTTKVRQVADDAELVGGAPGWARRVASEIHGLPPQPVTPTLIKATCDKLRIYMR